MLIRALPLALLLVSAQLAAHDAHHQPASQSVHAPQVVQAWARALPPNAPAAAVYLTVNNQATADRLLGAQTAIAARTELHTTRREGELLKMVREDSVALPAGAEVVFEPGGRHVMLMGLQQPLVAGEHFELTLEFAEAGKLPVRVEILEQAPSAEQEHPHAHHH